MLVDANLIYWVLSTGGASCYSIPPAFPQWILNQPFKADIAFIVQVKKWTPGSQEAESGFKTSAEPRGAFLTEAPYCLQKKKKWEEIARSKSTRCHHSGGWSVTEGSRELPSHRPLFSSTDGTVHLPPSTLPQREKF